MHLESKTAEDKPASIQSVQAHTYTFYFIALMLGLLLDFLFPFNLFKQSAAVPLGIGLIVLSSFIILWAQRTTLNLGKEHFTKEHFCKGPYCYTRNPTHWALSILMLGFGVLINAPFVIVFTVISFFFTRFAFLRKEESMMARKYGAPYLEYKKSVRS